MTKDIGKEIINSMLKSQANMSGMIKISNVPFKDFESINIKSVKWIFDEKEDENFAE